MDEPNVSRLIEQLRTGNAEEKREAERRLEGHFRRLLLARARRHLTPEMNRRVGESDVVQDVFRSVFMDLGAGKCLDVRTEGELRGLLAEETTRKARNAAKHHRRHKRDLRREARPGSAESNLDGLGGDAASPLDELIRHEQLARLEAALTPNQVRILRWLREGLTQAEVATRLGLSVRTIQRELARIGETAEALDRPPRMGDQP